MAEEISTDNRDDCPDDDIGAIRFSRLCSRARACDQHEVLHATGNLASLQFST
jgi:hypothetical protein